MASNLVKKKSSAVKVSVSQIPVNNDILVIKKAAF